MNNLRSFNEIKEDMTPKISGSELGKIAQIHTFNPDVRTYDQPLLHGDSNKRHCPVENGQWVGERGDSTWKPDPEHIPKKANSDGQTWKEILKEHPPLEGIVFKDGEPNFDSISRGDVEIDEFSTDRSDNFDKADIELSKQKGCLPEEVAKWRKENGHTWHECRDQKTMQKVPSIIHNNIPHSGGISEAKKANGAQS